jgi:hypothetical protein
VPDDDDPDLDCWSPALPSALALVAERPGATSAIAAAIARPRPHVVLLVDRPQAAAPAAPEEPIDVILPAGFTVGPPVPLARTQAFRPARALCAPLPEPYVAPPVRLVDCPACAAKAGTRCAGFDRWDECHAERLWACVTRVGDAS